MEFENDKWYYIRTPTKKIYEEVKKIILGMGRKWGDDDVYDWEEHREEGMLFFNEMTLSYFTSQDIESGDTEIQMEDFNVTIEKDIGKYKVFVQKDDVTITDEEGDVITISKKQLKEIYNGI